MSAYHFKNIEFFYSPKEFISENNYLITGEEYNHIKKVLRKSLGDIIFITDGLGYLYKCKITKIEKNHINAEILESFLTSNEPNINIHLGVSLLKNPSKFDFIVEKATELGVKEIIPFISQYTIAQKSKNDRWNGIAISAMKQSQRSFLPIISQCTSFDDLINTSADLKLIADIDCESIKQIDRNIKDILILIGPEGGFSDYEIEKALQNGFMKYKLANTRLRTETAAIVSIPILLKNFEINL